MVVSTICTLSSHRVVNEADDGNDEKDEEDEVNVEHLENLVGRSLLSEWKCRC